MKYKNGSSPKARFLPVVIAVKNLPWHYNLLHKPVTSDSQACFHEKPNGQIVENAFCCWPCCLKVFVSMSR